MTAISSGPPFPPSYNPSPAVVWPHHRVAQMPLATLCALGPKCQPLSCLARPRDQLACPFPIFCSPHFQESLSPPSLPENTWHCPTLGLGQTVPSAWNALPLRLTKPRRPSRPSTPLASSETPPATRSHRRAFNTMLHLPQERRQPDHRRPRTVHLRAPQQFQGHCAAQKGCPQKSAQESVLGASAHG